MAISKEEKKKKQSIISEKIKAFKSQISDQPDTFINRVIVNQFLDEILALAKQQAKVLSLAEVVINCTPSNETDSYFKSLLQRNLYILTSAFDFVLRFSQIFKFVYSYTSCARMKNAKQYNANRK